MIGTIVIGILLICVIALVIFSLVKRKQKGKKILTCGGNCEACQSMCKYRSIEK